MATDPERLRVVRALYTYCRTCGSQEYDSDDSGRCVSCGSDNIHWSDRKVWWVRVGPYQWVKGRDLVDPKMREEWEVAPGDNHAGYALIERKRTWGPYQTKAAALEQLARMQTR